MRAVRPLKLLPLVASALWSGSVLAVPTLRTEVVASYPHDPNAFTQGLLLHCGQFFESTGLVGQSTLRRVDPMSGRVLESRDLPSSQFGEGLALVADRLIQLTWKDGVAHEYDLRSLEPRKQYNYDGEGWGLCYDGRRLVMSDGSSRLQLRSADDFEPLGSIAVTSDGTPVQRLNELECVGDLVYANVWLTDTIVAIDAASGNVRARIDASGLLDDVEAAAADTLNGIAFSPGSGHFFITGKLWPKLFEVRFVDPSGDAALPAGASDAGLPEPCAADTPAAGRDVRGSGSQCGSNCTIAPGRRGWGLWSVAPLLLCLRRRLRVCTPRR